MIHRKQVEAGVPFTAPQHLTFGYQNERQAFSVWYEAGASENASYIVLGTGHSFPRITLVSSVVMPDGFHVFHLCRIGA
jgi:hypothetical protein